MTDYSELKRLAEAAMVMHSTFAENSKAAVLYGEASEADVVLALIAENEALRKNSERYQHLKAIWHDGGLLERLEANVLPEDWDSTIDADMGKGG